MDPRARRFAIRDHLNRARAALDRRDRQVALAAVHEALALDPDYLAAQALKDHIERWTPVSADEQGVATEPAAREAASAGPDDRAPVVSAEGWLRFERRARDRRIEKRAAAARLLVAHGRFAEARAAIEEIRELDAAHPDLISLSIELDAAEHLRPVRRRWWRVPAAAAAALLAGAVLFGTAYDTGPVSLPSRPLDPMLDLPSPVGPPVVPTVVPAAGPADAGSPPDLAPSDRATQLPVPKPPASPTPSAAPMTQPAARRAPTEIQPALPPPAAAAPSPASRSLPTSRPISDEPLPVAVRPAVTPAALPAGVAAEPSDANQAARAAERAGSRPAYSAGGAVGPVTPAAMAVADEDRVRRTLQQYQLAYESLDARSAQAVWPRVDEAALQRAFDGLESQRLMFDSCQVQVRGASGSAVCRGRTRYVPRVGSREPRVETRTWTFALRKAGDDWQIDSARAER